MKDRILEFYVQSLFFLSPQNVFSPKVFFFFNGRKLFLQLFLFIRGVLFIFLFHVCVIHILHMLST